MGITIIGISILLSGFLFGGLSIASKIISKKASSSGSGKEVREIELKISSLDVNISKALDYANNLLPLSEYNKLIKSKEEFDDNLTNERTKFDLLEAKLNEIQTKVSAEEQSHSSLKQGREHSIDLANSIKGKKAQLEADQKRLSEDLNNSRTQLTVLSSETKLTPDQEAGLNLIKTAISNSQEQLGALNQTYKQSSTRFATLHGQYSDLEKEFTKLIEKDLAGEENHEKE